MKMGELGVGLGLGAKDYRSVFIFHDKATLDKFINHAALIFAPLLSRLRGR